MMMMRVSPVQGVSVPRLLIEFNVFIIDGNIDQKQLSEHPHFPRDGGQDLLPLRLEKAGKAFPPNFSLTYLW